MARRAMFAGFLQALASVYLLSMVEFLVRVQMNVLGRAMYADIVRGDADADAALALDNEAPRTRTLLDAAERAFLSRASSPPASRRTWAPPCPARSNER